jgi:hypothetical protein
MSPGRASPSVWPYAVVMDGASFADVVRSVGEDPAARVTLAEQIAARTIDKDTLQRLIAFARSRQATRGQAIVRKLLTEGGVSWEAL